jgi:hypothetical protein
VTTSSGTVTVIERAIEPRLYLDTKVAVGSAPVWLVTRYVVECTYRTPYGIRNCGKALYGPAGGVVEGQISDEGGSFPLTIQVSVTIDFEPESGLPGLTRNFSPEVTDTGVNFIFEPYQVVQKTNLVLDLRPTPFGTDYVLLRWKHRVRETVIASGQRYLSGDELRAQPVTQYEIVFVPDPVHVGDLSLEIEGRYQDQALTRFTGSFELSERAILLRAKAAHPGNGYMLIVV